MLKKDMIPTIEQVMKYYIVIAAMERMKSGRPCDASVLNTIKGTKSVCKAAGIRESELVTALTRKAIDRALVEYLNRGLTRTSAWSYVNQLRCLFARWCHAYYLDAGWNVPRIELPVFRVRSPRYNRPSSEQLQRVKNWYKLLKGEYWFAATMMLEFAMRNGDVLRLRDSNFIEGKDGVYLSYTPHKTELTSGRHVYWPIHPEIWRKFDEYGRLPGLDVTKETFQEMNQELRSIGFHGAKASYELRKICIDHVYQKYGAEMAVSISGDNIATITHYYADPACPNFGFVRIVDLI